MISADDKIQFNGTVTSTGTGTFDVSISEFYVDGEWKSFSTPQTMTIASTDYTSKFTSKELEYIKKKAESDSKSTTLCSDDLAIVKSIASKLKDK